LQGEEGDGFLFRSELFFRTTRELEFFFFFLHQNQNIFLEKTHSFTVSNFYKNLVKRALTEIESSVVGTTTLDSE
jgi:hypothetical protein